MKKRKFPKINFRWVMLFNIIVVISSALSAVLIAVYDYNLQQEHIQYFLRIAPVVVSVSALVSCVILLIFRKRINRLFDTLQTVANGDFVIAVDIKEDDEYGTAYKNLSRVVNELKGSKQEMQQFTNEFLHEFKTPITAIHGFAEYLISTGKDIESPERMKYLKIIADESLRLSDLSQKNLMLAKVDACQIVINKTEYDLSEQIKNCTILLLPQIEKKRISLEIDVENLTYYGNEELMEQVWLNLISNAIKFTPEHGEISIKGTSDTSGITLNFSDSGMGMDEETQKHIFEKYYQGTSGRQKGGNGVGLSIVQKIIDLCNGRIDIESAENIGSTFTVFLPKE